KGIDPGGARGVLLVATDQEDARLFCAFVGPVVVELKKTSAGYGLDGHFRGRRDRRCRRRFEVELLCSPPFADQCSFQFVEFHASIFLRLRVKAQELRPCRRKSCRLVSGFSSPGTTRRGALDTKDLEEHILQNKGGFFEQIALRADGS